jgi:hypothetical protein
VVEESTVRARTEAWVRDFVIALDICPFAARIVSQGGVRMSVSDAETPEALCGELAFELRRLAHGAPARDATTLLIHPNALRDFTDFNGFLDVADRLLAAEGLVGVVQIASFHPDYRFAGTTEDAPENYTNRSPYPMLHLLLEADVSQAVDMHPDPAGIPARNIEKLRALGTFALRERLRDCDAEANPSRSDCCEEARVTANEGGGEERCDDE